MSSWTTSSSFPNFPSSVDAIGTNSTGSVIYAYPSGTTWQKSSDGGATWTALSSTSGYLASSIIVSNDGQTVYSTINNVNTGSKAEIVKSTDGGSTWSTLVSFDNAFSVPITSIASSSDMSVLYYSRWHNGIYKSTDGGSTWTQVLSGTNISRWRDVRCSADGSVVAVVKHNWETGQVYISTNGGSSWNQYGSNTDYNSVYVSGNGRYIYGVPLSGTLQAFENTAGTISVLTRDISFPASGDIVTSQDGQIVLALSVRTIYKSTNAGASFTSEILSTDTGVSLYSLTASRTADKAYVGGQYQPIFPPSRSARFYSYSGTGSDLQDLNITLSSIGETTATFTVNNSVKPSNLSVSGGGSISPAYTGATGTVVVTGLTSNTAYTLTFSTTDSNFLSQSVVIGPFTTMGGGVGAVAVPCFLADAPVLTPSGYKPIASLRAGDKVQTADGRVVRIVEAGHYRVPAAAATRPYVIPAGRFGAIQDLHISPAHRVQVAGGEMVEAQHIAGLKQDASVSGMIDYYNLELPNWTQDNMVVAGVTVESKARVERYTVSAAEFAYMLKAKYGEVTPALLERAAKTCHLVEGGRVSVPMVKRA
jgi:photosystem II stability/assembly factor-like uncharacterized protein